VSLKNLYICSTEYSRNINFQSVYRQRIYTPYYFLIFTYFKFLVIFYCVDTCMHTSGFREQGHGNQHNWVPWRTGPNQSSETVVGNWFWLGQLKLIKLYDFLSIAAAPWIVDYVVIISDSYAINSCCHRQHHQWSQTKFVGALCRPGLGLTW